MSSCLHTRNSRTVEQILVKSDAGEFEEKLSSSLQFVKSKQVIDTCMNIYIISARISTAHRPAHRTT
jgi:hypothetical protein